MIFTDMRVCACSNAQVCLWDLACTQTSAKAAHRRSHAGANAKLPGATSVQARHTTAREIGRGVQQVLVAEESRSAQKSKDVWLKLIPMAANAAGMPFLPVWMGSGTRQVCPSKGNMPVSR
mmetsp:Transcript_69343/g.162961  ORF Transcript_69343/g.162961 Transcript_69343/m.162961 type:complete len:121 (+) Transcript_69343:130-492(+)